MQDKYIITERERKRDGHGETKRKRDKQREIEREFWNDTVYERDKR